MLIGKSSSEMAKMLFELFVFCMIFTTALVLLVSAILKSIELKKKDIQNRMKERNFTVEYGIGLKILKIVCFVVMLLIFVINFGNVFWDWEIGTGSTPTITFWFFVITLFSYLGYAGTNIYKVSIENQTITYRNLFFITHQYDFSEIDKIVIKVGGKIIVWSAGKRIFTIDNNMVAGPYFVSYAENNHLKIERE